MQDKRIFAKTERLILRRFEMRDLAELYAYVSDPEVVRFEPYAPMTLDEARENLAWRVGTDEMIAVEHRESGTLIGNVYLGAREFDAFELGYVFGRAYWRRGYAAESCRAMVERAFGCGAHRVYAECDPQNESSWRLLESLGFRREAHMKSNVYFRRDERGEPVWKDTFVYARLRGE